MAVIRQEAGKALVTILQQNHNGEEVQRLAVQAIVQLVHHEEALQALISWGAIEAMNELVSTGYVGYPPTISISVCLCTHLSHTHISTYAHTKKHTQEI